MKRVAYNPETRKIEISCNAVDFLIKHFEALRPLYYAMSLIGVDTSKTIYSKRVEELAYGFVNELAVARSEYKTDSKNNRHLKIVVKP